MRRAILIAAILTFVVSVAAFPATVSSSAFTSDADGWATSGWRATDYGYGTMDWVSSGGNPGGVMQCNGAGGTDNDDYANREGGEIQKTISTVGFSGITVSYDLKCLRSIYDYYLSGQPVVDHGLVEEQLTIFYSTNGGSAWTEATYLNLDTLKGYTSYGTRTVDLSGITAADNNASFALRFRWQFNNTEDFGYLDNIVVSGAPVPEPSSLLAFGVFGIGALGFIRRRRA